jgi:hypothetical protein
MFIINIDIRVERVPTIEFYSNTFSIAIIEMSRNILRPVLVY